MAEKKSPRKKVNVVMWALAAITVAIIWMLPDGVPSWAFFIPVGLIFLVGNFVKPVVGAKPSIFGIILGTVLLIIGAVSYLGVSLPAIPIIIIVVALVIIVDTVFGK